jgi:hypothetical protein
MGSSAIAASQGISKGILLEEDLATTPRELLRLSQAGMAILASRSRLSALGYWNLGPGSIKPTAADSLCLNTIIETTSAVSILLVPYIILLVVLFPLTLVSYMDWINPSWEWWRKRAIPWKLYTAGQMHRKIVEQKYGGQWMVDLSTDYPPLEPASSGLDFVNDDNPLRFNLGKYQENGSSPATLPYSIPPFRYIHGSQTIRVHRCNRQDECHNADQRTTPNKHT